MIAFVDRIRGGRALAAALTVALAGLTSLGCGGKEEPAAAPAPTEQSIPAAVEDAADAVTDAAGDAVAAVADAVLPEGAPSTLAALRLMPAEAQAGIGIPPLNALLDQVVPIAKRIWTEEEVDAEIAKFTRDIAEDAGTPDAETIQEIAVAKGIDPDAAMAIFGDFTPMADSAIAFAQETAALSEEERADAMEDFEPDVPAWAVVVGIGDAALAEASIQEDLIGRISELQTAETSTETVGGTEIHVYGDYGYFLTDDQAVLGALPLVKAAAGRLASPASFRYGTDELPAYNDDEIVAMFYTNRAAPLLTRVLESVEGDAALEPMLQIQLTMLQGLFNDDSDDPVVTTLTTEEDEVALVSRIDTKLHKGVLDYAGAAQPLRLARLLPDHTLAMLSYRLSDELKTYINDVVFPSAVEAMGDDGTKQGVAMSRVPGTACRRAWPWPSRALA